MDDSPRKQNLLKRSLEDCSEDETGSSPEPLGADDISPDRRLSIPARTTAAVVARNTVFPTLDYATDQQNPPFFSPSGLPKASSSSASTSATTDNRSATTSRTVRHPSCEPWKAGMGCVVCGGISIGRRYCVIACNTCMSTFCTEVQKGFQAFYRNPCRYNETCKLTKDYLHQSQCRFCRLKKCIAEGMQANDAAYHRRASKASILITHFHQYPNNVNSLSIRILATAESSTRQFHPVQSNHQLLALRLANFDDIRDSLKQQLITLVEWAKHIPAFKELYIGDQVALLKTHAVDNLLLGIAWRSVALKDCLLLRNNCIIPRYSLEANTDITSIGTRIMDELIPTFRDTEMDEQEYAIFKAMVIFDASGRYFKNIEAIYTVRSHIQILLEDYGNRRAAAENSRFGRLLLALPVLRAIARQLVEILQFTNVLGIAKVDDFIIDLSGTVKNEIDIISQPGTSSEEPTTLRGLTVDVLVSAENLAGQIRPFKSDIPASASALRFADMNDVSGAMKKQLPLLLEWVKHIPAFQKLLLADQVSLLKAHIGKLLVLSFGYRSVVSNENGFMRIRNNCIITSRQLSSEGETGISHIAAILIEDLVHRITEMKENLYAIFKALTLFDPSVNCLQDVAQVKALHNHIQQLLADYTETFAGCTKNRLPWLLATLQTLKRITSQLIGEFILVNIFDNLKVDSFIQEMLLQTATIDPDTNPQAGPSGLNVVMPPPSPK